MIAARLTLGVVLSAVPLLVSAKTADVELQIFPSTLTFSYAGARRHGVVVVRNVSSDELRDLRLSALPESDLSVVVDPHELKLLAPRSEFGWSIVVTATTVTALADSLQLRLDYVKGSSAAPARSLAFAALPVRPSDLGAVENLTEAQIRTTLETLSEQRPGKLYVVVRNKSSFQIELGTIEVRAPPFIKATTAGRATVLAPRETRTLDFEIRAVGRVVPGKHLVVFDIPLTWKAHGQVFERHLVESQEVNVAVLGESEILKLLGVPSFLLLPGFLFLITLRFLWSSQFFGTKNEAERFSLKTDKPEFWAMAITLSGIMAFVYPLLTGHSYLESYNLTDIGRVWLIAVAASVLCWLLLAVAWQQWRAHVERARTPSENDPPLGLLEKLDRQGLGLQLSRVSFKSDGKTLTAFLLQSPEQTGDSAWVGPGIVVRWLPSATERMTREVDEALAVGRTSLMVEHLRKATKASAVNLAYKTGDVPARPTNKKPAELTPLNPMGLVIEVDRS